MNKTLQGQRALPGSSKRIKLWGLCTSQCVNNKAAVYAFLKDKSRYFPHLERASQSLLRRFKYFKCKVRYKGCYESPLPLYLRGCAAKHSADSAPFKQTQNAEKEGKEEQLFPATTSCKLSVTLRFLSLSLPLPPLLGAVWLREHAATQARTKSLCLFPNIFKKITALGLMLRIYSLYLLRASIHLSFLFPPRSFLWKLLR